MAQTLQMLDLEGNQVTDAGAVELAAALRENTALRKLDLENNQIMDAGKAQLRDAWGDREADKLSL